MTSIKQAIEVADLLRNNFRVVFIREHPKHSGNLQVIAREHNLWGSHERLVRIQPRAEL